MVLSEGRYGEVETQGKETGTREKRTQGTDVEENVGPHGVGKAGFGETEDVPRQRQRREISSPHPNHAFYRHLSPVTWTTPTPHSPGSDEVLGQGDGDRGTSDGHVPLASTFRLVPDLDMCP